MKTVSLELVKQLKEHGFVIPHSDREVFYWHKPGKEWVIKFTNNDNAYNPHYYAPTAEEILDLLPDSIPETKDGKGIRLLRIDKQDAGFDDDGDPTPIEWSIYYETDKYKLGYPSHEFMTEESLAEAAGKMWLYLKKEGLL